MQSQGRSIRSPGVPDDVIRRTRLPARQHEVRRTKGCHLERQHPETTPTHERERKREREMEREREREMDAHPALWAGSAFPRTSGLSRREINKNPNIINVNSRRANIKNPTMKEACDERMTSSTKQMSARLQQPKGLSNVSLARPSLRSAAPVNGVARRAES